MLERLHDGETSGLGEACDLLPAGVSDLLSASLVLDDPLCGHNLECAFVPWSEFGRLMNGVCVQACSSAEPGLCTDPFLGAPTSCTWDDALTDMRTQEVFDPDGVAPYLGICGVGSCTGTLTYHFDSSTGIQTITGGTASDACTDAALPDCYLVTGSDDYNDQTGTGTYTVLKGVCGPAR